MTRARIVYPTETMEYRVREFGLLVHRFIQLMQLDVPSALSRRRPGSTFAVGTGFRRCSGIGMSDGAPMSDELCE